MNSRILVQTSLLLNGIMAGSLVFLILRRPTPSAPAPPTIIEEALAKEVNLPRPHPRSYSSLAVAADWRQWIDQLREAGVPVRVLARLAREGFDDDWQKRQADAQAAYMRGDLTTDDLAALGIEHDFEQEKAIRAALGEEDFRKWDMQNVLDSVNLHGMELTTADANALYGLLKDHRRQLEEIGLAKLKGEIDQATMETRQAAAQAGHEAQLKALLGEQRYAIVQGVDDTAAELQRGLSSLGGVGLRAEASFETLLAVQKQWNGQRSEMAAQLEQAKKAASSSEEELKRIDAMRDQEFERLLGTNVFSALERGQDARYKEMKRHVNDWGLDETVVDYLYRAIRYYEKAVDDYQRQARAAAAQGQDVDWDAVNKNVKEFAQQNEKALRNYLGDARYDAVRRNQILPFDPR